MAKHEEGRKVSPRRDFLKLVSLGTVLGGAALTTGTAAVAAEPDTVSGDGYRETDHVKTYYDLARF